MFQKNDQEKRKANSIKILKKHGIPYIDHLPLIESEKETTNRSKEEVCDRAICLSLVAAYAEGLDKETLDNVIGNYQITNEFTEEEKAFIAMDTLDDNTKAKFLWRYEALWTLLWALSYVDELDMPTGICDVPFAVKTIVDRGRTKFTEEAILRTKKEILDQSDLIFRIHWATTDARLKNYKMPAGMNNDTVYERHYALNWLINYMDQEWDEISTDT
jgi:hypothetical protein